MIKNREHDQLDIQTYGDHVTFYQVTDGTMWHVDDAPAMWADLNLVRERDINDKLDAARSEGYAQGVQASEHRVRELEEEAYDLRADIEDLRDELRAALKCVGDTRDIACARINGVIEGKAIAYEIAAKRLEQEPIESAIKDIQYYRGVFAAQLRGVQDRG